MAMKELQEGDSLRFPDGREFIFQKKVQKEFYYFTRINRKHGEPSGLHCDEVWLNKHLNCITRKASVGSRELQEGMKLLQGIPGYQNVYTYIGKIGNRCYLLSQNFGEVVHYPEAVVRTSFDIYDPNNIIEGNDKVL